MKSLLQIVQAGIAATGTTPVTETETMLLDTLLSFAALRDIAHSACNDEGEYTPERLEASLVAAKALNLWHWSVTETLQDKTEMFAEWFYPGD